MDNYEYVSIEELFGAQKRKIVVFGSGMLHRPIYPTKMPTSRLGNEFGQPGGSANVGPGTYDNATKTSFDYLQEQSKNYSNLGYVLGSRTGPRMMKNYSVVTPDPAQYQKSWSDRRRINQSAKPFLSGSDQFQVLKPKPSPAPGDYEHIVTQGRRVEFDRAFNKPIGLKGPIYTSKSDRPMSASELKRLKLKEAYLKLYW